jgi:hypothetical protein
MCTKRSGIKKRGDGGGKKESRTMKKKGGEKRQWIFMDIQH